MGEIQEGREMAENRRSIEIIFGILALMGAGGLWVLGRIIWPLWLVGSLLSG